MEAITIILFGLLGILLAYLLVKFGPRSRKNAQTEAPNEGLRNNRIGDGLRRLDTNKKKYTVMTQALLDETPDHQLIEAVLSNLWARMRPDMTDALTVAQAQSLSRQYIFALYAVTGGIKQVGFDMLKASPDVVLLPIALEALEALDLPQSAALMRQAIDEEDADGYREPYTDAFDAEGGKEKMIAYIRGNASSFLDLS